MFRISYLDLATNDYEQTGGFDSDKDAMEWALKNEREGKIIPLKLLVWSEYLQCYRQVDDLRA